MDEEKSLDFLGFPNYAIHSDGHVINLKRGKLVEGSLDRYGYKHVNLYNSTDVKTFTIHRLVGLAFIPAIDGKEEIDHINRNRSDNRVENLRWADHYDNQYNKGPNKTNALGQKNICMFDKYFRVRITKNKIIVFEKQFNTLKDAIQARDHFLSLN
jgi:hypothetical protein